jgi:FHS family L-fucose permease-like MFS transporter
MQNKYLKPLIVLTFLFFMWGLITVLNDILIPHMKKLFDLNYAQSTLVQLVFFSAYFFMSVPSGMLIERVGQKNGILIGLSVSAFGCILFYPAAIAISYSFFLIAFFVLASGITLLQVSANPFVAVLGPPETASSRLNLTQAFNSVGTTIAPLIGSALILDVATTTAAESADLVKLPYIILALMLVVIAVIVKVSHLPDLPGFSAFHLKKEKGKTGHAMQFKHLRLGIIGIFLYVGAEVAIGSLFVNYLSLPEIGALTEKEAGDFLALYWGGAMVGRFIGSALLQKISANRLLVIHATITTILVLISVSSTGSVAMWSIIFVGLFNSIMFANIFTLSIDGLGNYTNQASGFLCMAIVGGAVIPYLQGLLADGIGLHGSFILPALCYLYIVYYGISGYKHTRLETS